MTPSQTIVHLVRHGEVHNPDGILYGRLPGFHLSARGRAMAHAVAEWASERDIVAVHSSPLQRAQETATPIAKALNREIVTDIRLLEATNIFEGKRFSVGDGALRSPSAWRHLWNPFRPSWGEPYKLQITRMLEAVEAARSSAEGHEAICVSHQLPIWIARRALESGRLIHDPRRRVCTLASVTSVVFHGSTMAEVRYSEPAAHLLPANAPNLDFGPDDESLSSPTD
jgi:broad specificity phosphatase PhoE